MPLFGRVGRTFTACVGKSAEIEDTEYSYRKPSGNTTARENWQSKEPPATRNPSQENPKKANANNYTESSKENELKAEMPDAKLEQVLKTLSDEFLARVQRDAVAVESIDHDDSSVSGYVRVRNDAHDKNVMVRYTINEWKSYEEVTAEWLELTDTNCDKFGFIIPSLNTPYTVSFAIRYEVLNEHYWDNNYHQNYEIKHGYSS